MPRAYLGLKNGDPGRIAAQVITGIGFLGGGAMIHMKGAVRGLTTAAGIWMTAIIGMAVGIGMYLCSIGATLLILLTLVTFEQYEKRRKLGQESKVINLTVEGIVGDIENYREVFRQHNVHLSTFYIEYDYEHNRTPSRLRGARPRLRRPPADAQQRRRGRRHAPPHPLQPDRHIVTHFDLEQPSDHLQPQDNHICSCNQNTFSL